MKNMYIIIIINRKRILDKNRNLKEILSKNYIELLNCSHLI